MKQHIVTFVIVMLSVVTASALGYGHSSKKRIPRKAAVIELTHVKDNEALELTIDFGRDVYVKKKLKLKVVMRHYIQDREMFRTIGEVKVESLINYHQALCKVTKGKEEIYKVYLETPDDLFVTN